MSGQRPIKTSRRGSIERYREHRFDPAADGSGSNELICVLVLDHTHETAEQIQDALWVWPHKVINATSIKEVVRICQHTQPTALIAAIDFSDNHDGNTITTLRQRLPQVPIIAIGPGSDSKAPANILGQGADAFLLREELHRPALHDLLTRVQRTPRIAPVSAIPPLPKMQLPWRQSRIIGALTCAVSGTIIDANHCISRWLGYRHPDSLLGRCMWPDLLGSRAEWSTWKKVAGDTSAFLHQSTELAAKSGQNLRVRVEVFAAPCFPSHLQAVFVHPTEENIS